MIPDSLLRWLAPGVGLAIYTIVLIIFILTRRD
jgi:hypothetical protein